MLRGTRADWFFIGVQLLLVLGCVFRAIDRENPLYYGLAVFWLIMGIVGIVRHLKAKNAPKGQASQGLSPAEQAQAFSVPQPEAIPKRSEEQLTEAPQERSEVQVASQVPQGRSSTSVIPDMPQPIGYKTGWLCIKGVSPEQVITALGLKNAVPANWQSGLSEQSSKVFVSSAVHGYVLVTGYDVFFGGSAEAELGTLARIAQKLPEVQCFETHRIVDFHTWAKFVNGSLVRAYGWLGESGVVFLNRGEITPEEVQLGFDKFIQSEEDDWEEVEFPDEESVMQIAAAWGVDPFFADGKQYECGVGYLCDLT